MTTDVSGDKLSPRKDVFILSDRIALETVYGIHTIYVHDNETNINYSVSKVKDSREDVFYLTPVYGLNKERVNIELVLHELYRTRMSRDGINQLAKKKSAELLMEIVTAAKRFSGNVNKVQGIKYAE